MVGYPHPGQVPGLDGGYPGYPIQVRSQVRMGGLPWGTPHPGLVGVHPIGTGWCTPPQPGLDRVSPVGRQNNIHCYTAGGMPLAFTPKDFLVFLFINACICGKYVVTYCSALVIKA